MESTRAWPVLALVGVVGIGARVAEFSLSPTADPLTVVVGSLIPIGFAAALLALLWWIRYDDRTTITDRTVGWCLLGGALIAGIEGTTILYQQTQGVVLTERRLTLVNAFVRGTLLGLLIGLYDHQRRAAIRTSRESETRRDRLEEFASVVAHDLRNPLSVAKGYLTLAREGDEAAFDRVADALERTEQIVDDTLTLAREGESATRTETVSLAALARGAWSTTADAEGAAGEAAGLDVVGDATIDADPVRLRRLLENLFRNAIEHGGADGPVTVTVAPTPTGFVVADDGPGIPAAERGSVLDAGYTTAADGTGFGLAIVSRIADAHGWTVSIEESDAGGATFVFETR
ncbi:HAMP domain-containing sensor histidine kinase [Halorubrum sp. AD140]|uniref:sensor histidine kinase n=1 Tax=Halorubrum sp. AD140 TaxID=3050073 RepID=UPI002ACCBB1C|nr:HAMP domain-containing sensor histidine kinase [Halorubrum sp. AD140]MDZ5812493.1 HAMP domain-containing sensor histidine kinase [Halorubrum sp. AD140]